MDTQYVAGRSCHGVGFEALPPQRRDCAWPAYISPEGSGIFGHGCAVSVATANPWQEGEEYPNLPLTRDRRHLCPRASNSSWRLAWLPLRQLVRSQQKKNTLWSSPSRFRSSRSIPENTSKISAGRAFAPVPTPALMPATRGRCAPGLRQPLAAVQREYSPLYQKVTIRRTGICAVSARMGAPC